MQNEVAVLPIIIIVVPNINKESVAIWYVLQNVF